MSEFSESYHLRANTLDDGIALLRSARLPGFVFRPANGWVTVLAAGEPFVPNRKLIKANPSLLLRYFFAEDHGWGFDIHRQAFPAALFEVDWDAAEIVKHPCTLDTLALVAPAVPAKRLRQLVLSLNDDDFEQALGDENAGRFATVVGLPHYTWLSYAYAVKDYGDPKASKVELAQAAALNPTDANPPFKFSPAPRA